MKDAARLQIICKESAALFMKSAGSDHQKIATFLTIVGGHVIMVVMTAANSGQRLA
jgi:hypothetical protein